MEHTTVTGEPKLLPRCTLPVTAFGVVTSVVTDLAWIDARLHQPLVRSA